MTEPPEARLLRQRAALLARLRETIALEENGLADRGQTGLADFRRLVSALGLETKLRAAYKHESGKMWTFAVVATVCMLALLQFVRCNATEVDARLVLSALDFTALARGEITFPPRPSISVGGLTHLDLAAPDGASNVYDGSPERTLQLKLTPEADAEIAVSPLTLGAGSHLNIAFTSSDAIGIRGIGPAVPIEVSMFGKVAIASPAGAESRDYTQSSPVHGVLGGDYFLGIATKDWGRCTICTPLRVDALQTWEEYRASGEVTPREISAVREGEIRFSSLGSAYTLRRGETLDLKFTKRVESEILAMVVHPDRQTYEVTVHGWVDRLNVGSAADPIDLRPTWLEWLRTRHGPELVWGSCVWLFGALAAVRGWLQRSKAA